MVALLAEMSLSLSQWWGISSTPVSNFMGKSQKTPPQAVGMRCNPLDCRKAGDLGAAAPVRAKLAQASSLRKPRRFAPGSFTGWSCMYALWTFYSVPQVVKGLGPDRRGAVRAILVGLGINGMLTAAVALVALGISNKVTEVAIIGIAERIGPWAGLIGSLFIASSLVTSYWSVSLALADILHERTGISGRLAWLLATLPSLLILWIGAWQFLEWLRLAAGATAIVVALITIPMYRQARLSGPVEDPGWTLGRWGSPAMLALALLTLVLMTIGSLVSMQ